MLEFKELVCLSILGIIPKSIKAVSTQYRIKDDGI
ncbi:hypothetical protein SAMN05444342_4205 [Haladaptatus paucihalophilus DX253]|uniref:Uncharacterized protein n=1 Tax=Haladaptatus paucihalophilus DX253 TaxID=797209 RepID=A0A1M7BXB6_HALPU|nr:hypothetical protein SAMN05444342_4205 [Haladaptatus paucihalophilus DX253]